MDHLRSLGSQLRSSILRYGVPIYETKGEDIELCNSAASETTLGSLQPNGHITLVEAKSDGVPPSQDMQSGGTSSVWQAGWNVGNCMQGIGMLSLPYMVREGGLAALITMAVVLIIGNYTSKVLVYCLYEDRLNLESDGKPYLVRVRNTYADVADACYKSGGTVLNVMQIVDVIAVAALYLELAGSLLVDTFSLAGLSKLTWTVLCAVFLLPTIFFRNLTKISWLSCIAVLSLIIMFFSVVWYSLGKSIVWDIKSVPAFNLQTYSVSASIILFNFGTQFIMPGVEDSMKNRSRFNRMVNCTYLITGVLNIAYALFAYLSFGMETKEFITYNMPLGPLQAAVSMLFVIKSLLSYPLMLFLIVNSVDSMKLSCLPPCSGPNPDRMPPVWAMIFRALLVLFTLLLAVIIPHFTLLMGVTGSLTSPWLDFIFPCLFYLKLRRNSLKCWEVVINYLIIGVGVLGGVVGLIYSMKALVHAYAEDFS
ncbi:vesicular inhibitory amino acid transporter-like [Patiria miniata]|uniref:Amino acid transporter transmembrane domain-containing protein n=1 Tax=Patiria miniata TaxID=46514 RepID=A0A914BQE4_PATMI|nr:vesicular inhibitory amino acid transporter-like [Patiria miniata]XP_038078180.1 vesicular inhibitory amino acid transporter-like [Patiria miniata]